MLRYFLWLTVNSSLLRNYANLYIRISGKMIIIELIILLVF